VMSTGSRGALDELYSKQLRIQEIIQKDRTNERIVYL
jgi:hypothetical protein